MLTSRSIDVSQGIYLCDDVMDHLRLQPCGDGSRRLIYINEFVKHGYHLKALIDKVKDGELSIE